MATDFDVDIILCEDGWSPPTCTSQSALRILKNKQGKQFIGKYNSSAATKAKNKLLQMLLPYKLQVPYDCPLYVNIYYELPWRKSEPKKNLEKEYMHHDVRPDADNLLKLLLDSMNGIFWKDDSLISKICFHKTRGHNPRIRIRIKKLHN